MSFARQNVLVIVQMLFVHKDLRSSEKKNTLASPTMSRKLCGITYSYMWNTWVHNISRWCRNHGHGWPEQLYEQYIYFSLLCNCTLLLHILERKRPEALQLSAGQWGFIITSYTINNHVKGPSCTRKHYTLSNFVMLVLKSCLMTHCYKCQKQLWLYLVPTEKWIISMICQTIVPNRNFNKKKLILLFNLVQNRFPVIRGRHKEQF